MKKVIIIFALTVSFASAVTTCITTCDIDGRNCTTTCTD